MKTIPLPVSFFVVLCVTLALLVFFGAWAVSADGDERDRVLAFAVPGVASINAETTPQAGQSVGLIEPLADESGLDAADTWWGGALLTACPLH